MPESIRVSVGTAASLDLLHCKLDAIPTTAYTMISTETRCSANCAFCAQARESGAKANQLSRISWPNYPLTQFLQVLKTEHFGRKFQRLCIQTLCYPNLMTDLEVLVKAFKERQPAIPISIALPPMSSSQIQELLHLGVDRVAISIDAVTPELFDAIKGRQVKGPFKWETHYQALQLASKIFGAGQTTTHIIIGLGETDEQAVHLFQRLSSQGITIGLFPFTPIAGTPLANRKPPPISRYRRIQLAHYLLQNHLVHANQIQIDPEQKQLVGFELSSKVLNAIIERGTAFQTAGCPSCNRPFFTESPGGPLYNFPTPLSTAIIKEIRNQIGGIV